MTNPFSLEGKSIFVTGASSGIGRAIAIECSKMGATMLITARNEERLNETMRQLHGNGHESFCVEMTDEKSVERLVEELGELDGVVLCEQHRVVTPGHPLPPHLSGEGFQRLHARLDGRHARLDVLAVGGDGVETIGGEAVGYFMQPGQDGLIVLGAEHHAIHLVRRKVVAGDEMRIAGVAHQHIPLRKAAQQPVGVILHGVGAPAGLDDRGPRPLSLPL